MIAGYVMNLCVTFPASLVRLAWHPAAHLAFWAGMTISIALIAPATALLRSLGGIAGGVIAGAFFDYAGHIVSHQNVSRLMPVWQILFTIPAFVCVLLLYRIWKRYSGDDENVPPVPGEHRVAHPAEEAAGAALPIVPALPALPGRGASLHYPLRRAGLAPDPHEVAAGVIFRA